MNFKKIYNTDNLYICGYVIFLMTAVVQYTFLAKYIAKPRGTQIYEFVIFLVILKELLKWDFRVDKVAFFIFLMYIIILDSGWYYVIAILWLMYGARNIEFKKIAIATLIVLIPIFITIVYASLNGTITNYVYGNENIRRRECLGFLYPLYPSALLANIIMLYIYIRNKKITLIELAICFYVNHCLYIRVDGRLSYYLTILVIIIGLIGKFTKKFKMPNLLKLFVMLIPLFTMIFTYAIVKNYTPEIAWMAKADSIFGGRLHLMNDSLNKHGIPLFGQMIQWNGNGLNIYGEFVGGTYDYVDSIYMIILQRYGIVFSCMFAYFITRTIYIALLNDDYYLVIMIIILSGHAIIDDLIAYPQFNTFILLIQMQLPDRLMGRIGFKKE